MSDMIPAIVKTGVVLRPGRDANGVEHWSAPWIEYYPGDTIMLPADELAHLQRVGAVVSPPPVTRRMIPA